MNADDKQLLLQDLTARLPYAVKGKVYAEVTKGEYDSICGDMVFFDAPFDVTLDAINVGNDEIEVTAIGNEDTVTFIDEQQHDAAPYTIEEFTPYLRLMSSMTEEEKEELLCTIVGKDAVKYFQVLSDGNIDNTDATIQDLNKFNMHWINFDKDTVTLYLDWLNVHHFDYRGLIEKGLALPAPEGIYN